MFKINQKKRHLTKIVISYAINIFIQPNSFSKYRVIKFNVKDRFFPGLETDQMHSSLKDTNGTSDSDTNAVSNVNRPIMDKYSVRQFCTQESTNLFRCNLCRKTYTHISNFCRHFLSSHHGVRQEVPCPVCTRMFTRRDNMLTHMKQVHRVCAPKVYATNNNTGSRFEFNSL